jgi:Putative peptidoglycan binding domain
MKPYVIRDGDHLQRLATSMGFDADSVWADPKNADLCEARGSMHILCPGDVLYVPKEERKWQNVATGSVNRFVANVPKIEIALAFTSEGEPLACEPCSIRELPELGDLTTDAQGTLRFDAPVTLHAVTIDFPGVGVFQVLRIGNLNPISVDSGAQQRLNNLGFDSEGPSDSPDASDGDGPSAGGDGPDDEDASDDDPDDNDDNDDDAPDPALSEAIRGFQRARGLDVTGLLDDETRQQLEKLYGC